MSFFVPFLWYILAFLVGALVAWLVVRSTIEPTSEDEAFADLPRSRHLGGSL